MVPKDREMILDYMLFVLLVTVGMAMIAGTITLFGSL